MIISPPPQKKACLRCPWSNCCVKFISIQCFIQQTLLQSSFAKLISMCSKIQLSVVSVFKCKFKYDLQLYCIFYNKKCIHNDNHTIHNHCLVFSEGYFQPSLKIQLQENLFSRNGAFEKLSEGMLSAVNTGHYSHLKWCVILSG